MRISELSKRSEVSVPTIKYYVREGLLHRGELTSPNQARYDGSHLRRLRLVGALTEVGGLPVATARKLLTAIDSGDTSPHRLMGHTLKSIYANDAVDRPGPSDTDLSIVDALAERRGWYVHADSPMRSALAHLLAAYRAVGHEPDPELLDGYARSAEAAAAVDLDAVGGITGIDELLETAVVGTVLGDQLLALLRRLAQASESQRRQGP